MLLSVTVAVAAQELTDAGETQSHLLDASIDCLRHAPLVQTRHDGGPPTSIDELVEHVVGIALELIDQVLQCEHLDRPSAGSP